MECPECGKKLSTKHYDAVFEWYECPKCVGCFTYDEILEGGIDESDESKAAEAKGNSRGKTGKKASRGRSKERKHTARKKTALTTSGTRRKPTASLHLVHHRRLKRSARRPLPPLKSLPTS